MNYNISSAIRYLRRIDFGFFLIYSMFPRLTSRDFDKTDKVISHIKRSIQLGSAERSKLLRLDGYNILTIPGMSSPKVRHLLNNLCSIRSANHLEVGSWRGSTLISSKFKNNINSIAIDNWSQFNGPKEDFFANLKKYKTDKTTSFYDLDCFEVNLDKVFTEKIQIYFYDGDHSYESHFNAFTYFNEIFSDIFIAIVDDYNSESVQNGTQDAFQKLNYKVLFENFLPSSGNSDNTSWWNGIYIALIEKNHHNVASESKVAL